MARLLRKALRISSQPEVSKGPLKRGSSSKAFLFLAMQRPAPASHWMPPQHQWGDGEQQETHPLVFPAGKAAGSCRVPLPSAALLFSNSAKAKQPPCLGRSCFSLASGHSPSDLRPSWSPQTGLWARQTWPGPSQGSHARSPPAPHSAPPSMRPPWSGFPKGRGTGTEPVATRMQDRLHTAVPPSPALLPGSLTQGSPLHALVLKRTCCASQISPSPASPHSFAPE